MNKYIVRTSCVWIAIFAAVAGILAYRSHRVRPSTAINMPMPGPVQPVAAGPSAGADVPAPSAPEQKMETPLVPVQLTPQRMQSIGVQTGTVEYKSMREDIRATTFVQDRSFQQVVQHRGKAASI
jgi:hypothetical protein